MNEYNLFPQQDPKSRDKGSCFYSTGTEFIVLPFEFLATISRSYCGGGSFIVKAKGMIFSKPTLAECLIAFAPCRLGVTWIKFLTNALSSLTLPVF